MNHTSPNPKIKAKLIIFDLDGTLADTVLSIAEGANIALRRLGLPERDLVYVRRSIGCGATQLCIRLLPEEQRGEQNVARLAKTYREAYGETYMSVKELFPGMLEALKELHDRGILLAVLSNKPEEYTKNICDALIPDGIISMTLGQTEGRPIKPDPAGAEEICRSLGVSLSDTAMVGDGDTDVQVALRSGMTPVSVTWGYRTREQLTEAGAGIFADSPSELPGLFE